MDRPAAKVIYMQANCNSDQKRVFVTAYKAFG